MKRVLGAALALASIVPLSCGVERSVVPDAPVRVVYTEHLGQLTARGSNPLAPHGILGTDLGISFVHRDELVFLFGDSLTSDAALRDRDVVARAPLAASSSPRLRFLTRADGRLAPLAVPGVDLGLMNVPTDAFVTPDGTPHVFFATGWDVAAHGYTRSVLAHGDLADLVRDHDVATSKMVNVSVVVDGDTAWLFGTGTYRKSAIYLARAPIGDVADRTTWLYYRGDDASFVAGEEGAAPIVRADCAGELSVRKHPRLPIVLMLYACLSEPRGVRLHLAPSPAGPWSEPVNVFTPDQGYGLFMHRPESIAGYDDGLAPEVNAEDWGGEYAPYLVTPYFSEDDAGAMSIVYTMSSWVPYQVHLMRTVLAPASSPVRPVARRGELPSSRLTYSPTRAAPATSRREQTFTVDTTTRELTFTIGAGDDVVELRRGDEVLRSVRGRRSPVNSARRVRWRLDDFRGETLTLVIAAPIGGSGPDAGAYDFALE